MAYAKSSAPGPDRTQHCKRTACCRSTGTLPLIFSVSGLLAPKLRRPRGRSKAEMQKEMKRRKKGKREEIKARRERRGNRKNEKRSVKENLESLALTDPSLQGRESTSEHIKVCAVERQSFPGSVPTATVQSWTSTVWQEMAWTFWKDCMDYTERLRHSNRK